MIKTHEGGVQYEHSLDHAVEFFSKAGSLFVRTSPTFYTGEESALSLFQKIMIVDPIVSMKLLMWLRDCRGGAGNRSGAKSIYSWMAGSPYSPWVNVNLKKFPELGRWDDLRAFWGTPLETRAACLWADAIRSKDVLAAKWADRKDIPLQKQFDTNEAGLRKILSSIRKDHIVEHKMCSGNWKEIKYETVPSVAMARYTNAFGEHDPEGFESYKESLKSGEKSVHASVLFPHDCVRTVKHGDDGIADAQFDALPNYLEGADERIVVISDTSGSMDTIVSGSVRAVDISQGLALYCSARMPEDGPFYKKFIGFCSEGSFKDWSDMTFSHAVRDLRIFDRAVGSTRIDKALDLILNTAKFFGVKDDQMPTTLMIVSDMQFHAGVASSKATERFGISDEDETLTEVNKALNRWEKAGYSVPKIVYWNTAGYTGSPETTFKDNVAMISGFSPSILKAVLEGEEFTPEAVMLRALEKYEVIHP